MANDLTAAFGSGAGLPSRENVAEYLNSASQAVTGIGTGKQFLKISDKDGVWTFGAEAMEVTEDALWAINPISLFHGYIAWLDGKVEAEHRQPVSRNKGTLPPTDTLGPVKAKNGWEKLFGFDLVCVAGEDAGTLCEYKASSVGGSRAFAKLVTALNEQFAKNPDKLVPIVRLKDGKYWDDKYKKDQFPPVFEVVEWRGMDDGAPVEAEAPKEEPKPAPRQRAAAAPAAKPAPETEAPAEDDVVEQYEAEAAAQAEATPRRRQRR